MNHCVGGPGGQPDDELGALVRWVEQGRAPTTLATSTRSSTGEVLTRKNVCRYPMVTKYTGHGDPADAASYRCVRP